MADLPVDALQLAFSAIQNTSNLEQRFYETLLTWSLEITAAQEGGILSVAHNQRSMRIECWKGRDVDLKSRILPITDPPSSVSARCVQSSTHQYIPDVRNEPLFLPKSESPVRSQLVVPVIHDGTVIGIINLESLQPSHFTDQHAAALLQFAYVMGPFWNLVITFVRDSRRRALFESLRDLARSLLTDAPAKTLEGILNESLTLTHSDLGGVCLLSIEKDVLVVWPAKGVTGTLTEPPRIPKGRGFVWRSLEANSPENIPDVREHSDTYVKLSGGGDVLSLLCVPMYVGSQPVGVLNMESHELNHFSFLDEEMLIAFAGQAAMAVALLDLSPENSRRGRFR